MQRPFAPARTSIAARATRFRCARHGCWFRHSLMLVTPACPGAIGAGPRGGRPPWQPAVSHNAAHAQRMPHAERGGGQTVIPSRCAVKPQKKRSPLAEKYDAWDAVHRGVHALLHYQRMRHTVEPTSDAVYRYPAARGPRPAGSASRASCRCAAPCANGLAYGRVCGRRAGCSTPVPLWVMGSALANTNAAERICAKCKVNC